MLDKYYKINNNFNFYVYCEINDYIDIIEKRMLMFKESKEKNYNNYIKIFSDKTIYKIGNNEKTIEGKIKHTDLYPLFYNIFANIINNENDMLLHSVVLCYNNIGILIVGDFGQGKTSLCLEAQNMNIDTISTDQTWLSLKDGRIMFEKGSRYMKINDSEDLIINEQNQQLEIKYIINLIGLCENGVHKYKLIENNYHKVKTLFKYFTWHSDIPLFTDNSLLYIDRVKILNWLKNVDIPLYNVRGDITAIIKDIKGSVIC